MIVHTHIHTHTHQSLYCDDALMDLWCGALQNSAEPGTQSSSPDENLPLLQLPPGWLRAICPTRNLPYYYNKDINITQWGRPQNPAKNTLKSAAALPPPSTVPPGPQTGACKQQPLPFPTTVTPSQEARPLLTPVERFARRHANQIPYSQLLRYPSQIPSGDQGTPEKVAERKRR